MSDLEETLVLVKPDGVARQLTGEVLRRIETKGYEIVDLKMVTASRELLDQHYEEHQGKPFFEPLVEFMQSGPVVAVRVAGNGVIAGFRSLAGTTDPPPPRPAAHPGGHGPGVGRPRARPLVRLIDRSGAQTR